MIPLSCANCCYNGLQFGSIGLSAGYCVEHRMVLRRADETTCARQLRKDLDYETREQSHVLHKSQFPVDAVQWLRAPGELVQQDDGESAAFLETDPVGEAVVNYRLLDTTFSSLAQLKELSGVRAELALLSLGRTYVRRCVRQGGAWTSGLHLMWWTRRRLSERPQIGVSDLRCQSAVSMERQAEIASWSLVMLRLQLIADIGAAAPAADPVFELRSIAEQAVEASDGPNLDPLLAWLSSNGQALVDGALPRVRYVQLRDELHQKRIKETPGEP